MSEYYDLGTYSRPITTGSAEAQRWFDRGLAWTYGYNHDEAIACYRKALDADPTCAMAWWGIAYAAGPNYNKPWEAFDEEDAARSLRTAYEATARAIECSESGTETEKALARALRSRYHFKIYGAMFLGQLRPALAAADEMIATLPEDLLTVESPPMADWLEGFVPMKQHVLIRFGKWRDILDQPLPENPELFCVTTAIIEQRLQITMARTDVPVTASCFCRLRAP